MAANKVVYGTLVLMDLTSDTATADDVAKGKTFHDKTGAQVTGSLTENDALSVVSNSQTVDYYVSTVFGGIKIPVIRMKAKIKPNTANEKTILNGEQSITIAKDASDFGDATASDVAKGKTFTSRNGLAITGTAEASSGPKIAHVTSPSDLSPITDAGFNAGAVTVYGFAKSFTLLISFAGNVYYKKGTSSPMQVKNGFLIRDDGSIKGLPTGMTECNFIVMQE